MAHIMDIEPGMDVYDPCCGSAGLLIKCELVLQEKMASHPSPRGRVASASPSLIIRHY